MESTLSTLQASDAFTQAHCPSMRRFCLDMFDVPSFRPPVLEEMQEDINRLIAKVARQYSDASCPELNFDELEAEGRLKLVHVTQSKGFKRMYTRVKFFQFFATSLNNHVRSLVHKYRFTEKRTGVKPPPKHAMFDGSTTVKTVEVRLDDPEIGVQVADQPCPSAKELDMLELMDDYESCLDPIEQLVFRQLSQPNETALMLARIDAHRGHRRGTPLKIKIKAEHLVAGLRDKDKSAYQMSVDQFKKTVLSIRRKITEHRSMTNNDEQIKIRRNAVLAQLEQVFNLQIPKTTDDMTIRRLLTICARDQYDKVESNTQVQALLEEVGAKVPRMQGDVLDCRGTLYQRNSRICNSCGYRHTCALESANFGLGKITISRHLLGAKQIRIPAILPNDNGPTEVSANSDEELEIITYLDENFKKVQNKGQEFYTHKEKVSGSTKLLFQVDNSGASYFRVRFCSPSEPLKAKLRYEHKCYFCPPGLSVGEIIAMIDTHAKETYAVA